MLLILLGVTFKMDVTGERKALLINRQEDEETSTDSSTNTVNLNRPIPYYPLAFIMVSAVLQSSFSGAQAIMEMFFSRFVFFCSHSKSKMYGTVAVNVFIAVNQLAALTGGFIADCLLGNFHTQNISNAMGTVGVFLVLLASWQYTLNQPPCHHHPRVVNDSGGSDLQLSIACQHELSGHRLLSSVSANFMPSDISVLLISIGCLLFSIANGHLNAAQSVFVGDQFHERTLSPKEKSFSWYFLFQNVGNLVCDFGIPFIRQSYGFVITFSVIAGAYGLATIVFVLGVPCYNHSKSEKRLCCCERSSIESVSISSLFKSKRELLSIFGVCLPMIGFWALFFQENSTWVLQGAMMNCYVGKLHIPPDMMPSFNDLMVILLIPTLDYIVYPHMKKTMHIHVKPLQKIIAGMVCVALSFLFAGLLQLYITNPLVSCRGSVSILWQIPQFLLMSLAEVLVCVTGIEFTYSQPPPRMRNIFSGVWCVTSGLGAALNAAIALIGLSLLHEFILYFGVMALVICVLVRVNKNFQYRTL